MLLCQLVVGLILGVWVSENAVGYDAEQSKRCFESDIQSRVYAFLVLLVISMAALLNIPLVSGSEQASTEHVQ